MASSELVGVLRTLQPFVYGGLFVVALVQWRRRPVRASEWLAATFGALATVVIAGQVLPDDPNSPVVEWAGKALLAMLVLFPYLLYRFTTSLIRSTTWVRVFASVLTAVLVVGAFAVPIPEQDGPLPALLKGYLAMLLIQWVFLCGGVAVRLWRSGRGQPTVARRRMRTMSLGASGLALALIVAGEFSSNGAGELVVQFLALGAAPLLLVGFAPPRFLRTLWRRHEESALDLAGRSLMEATTSSDVARVLLPHARRLVGASGVVLEDVNGTVLERDGFEGAESGNSGSVRDDDTGGPALNRSVVTIPMRTGTLIVETSPITPFFGHDELSTLEGLAVLADLALARIEVLESQLELAAIVESSDDAIISEKLDGTIASWNGGAERLYGYASDEAIGRSMSLLVPHDRRDEIPMILQRIRNNQSLERYETQRLTKLGRTIDVSLTISPFKDGEGRVVGASAIARDVSDRVKAERERESAREEADRANTAKSEFLSRMSHELRTPLNAVLGFAQLLEMDDLTPDQREGTEEILKAGKHLLGLIDEVLDISRIEEGKLRLSLEPVGAVSLAEDCISLLKPQAEHEGVRLLLDRELVEGSGYVTADRQRLRQVLLNLITNGIKYNRHHGSVTISFEAAGPRCLIHVTDTGDGIRADQIERLFAPFERLNAEGSGIEGTGLGLALSRRLCEAMAGTLSVTSEPGTGSTFTVDLLSARELEILVPEEGNTHEAHGGRPTDVRTILYIEDNLSNLRLLERLLARRPGIELLSTMQGRIGVTLARSKQPDLILLDLNLPDMHGEEVLTRLRSDPQTAELPVVVISADASDGQMRRALDAGAREFLTKPIDVGRLMHVVDRIVVHPQDHHLAG